MWEVRTVLIVKATGWISIAQRPCSLSNRAGHYHCFCSEAELEKQAEKAKDGWHSLEVSRNLPVGCPKRKCSSGWTAGKLQSFA